MLWLNVVKDGRTAMLPFTVEGVPADGAIRVDGYVNGVVLLSTATLGLTIDGNATHPVRKNADGSYHLKYFGSMNRNAFRSTFHTDELGQAAMDKMGSCYSRFPKIPGDALSDAPELRIGIVNQDTAAELTIQQNVPTKIDLLPSAATGEKRREVYYLGNDPSRIAAEPEAFNVRAQAILEGIRAVEAFSGSRLVEMPRREFTSLTAVVQAGLAAAGSIDTRLETRR